MNSEAIAIKGIREGVLVTLKAGPWDRATAALHNVLEKQAGFFQGGGRIALDVQERTLSVSQIEELRDVLRHYGVELFAVLGGDENTEAAAQSLGLVIELGPRQPLPSSPFAEPEEPELNGLVLRRTLRAGQQVHCPGDVVVIGDVHAGAEIVAGGNVLVWGALHGVVHAGALGDEQAVVCALDLQPTQLRIASRIARSPDERRRKPTPEMAMVRDTQIVAVSWRGR